MSDSLLALGSMGLLTGLIYWSDLHQLVSDSALLYLLVVLALASARGLSAALQASFLAFFLFDYLYVPPIYSIAITKFADIIALIVFLITAITTSHLASALRKRAEDASKQERETHILYDIIRATNREEDMEHQLEIFCASVMELFAPMGVRACSVLLPAVYGTAQKDVPLIGNQAMLSVAQAEAIAQVVSQGCTVNIDEDIPTRHISPPSSKDDKLIDNMSQSSKTCTIRFVPLKTEQRVVGVLRLCLENSGIDILPATELGIAHEHPMSQEVFFSTLLEQAVAVIERGRLQRESVHNKVLQQTDSLRAALLSSVSHDLRTPLTTIKSAASSLRQKDMHLDEEAREHFAFAIERESDRLNRLVENLLDMSRIEGGALSPRKVWYPLEEIVYTVVGHMQDLLQERAVHISLPPDLPALEIDYIQIGQVVTNLIENALRYTPNGSPIDIEVTLQEEYVQVSIADRGPGVPPGEYEHIFDKFYRVHREPQAADHDRGSGLGLAVSKGFVEAHNGRIWVENREGGGAVFRFTLPKGKIERGRHEQRQSSYLDH